MSRATRREVRAALAAGLAADLAGADKPFVAVYGYWRGDWGGSSPVLIVASAGLSGEPLTFEGFRAAYDFDLFVFVRRSEGAYSEADSDGALDDAAQAVFEWVEAQQRAVGVPWQDLRFRTQAEGAIRPLDTPGGHRYWMERISITVEAY